MKFELLVNENIESVLGNYDELWNQINSGDNNLENYKLNYDELFNQINEVMRMDIMAVVLTE